MPSSKKNIDPTPADLGGVPMLIFEGCVYPQVLLETPRPVVIGVASPEARGLRDGPHGIQVDSPMVR